MVIAAELRDKRAGLIAKAREIVAVAEGRPEGERSLSGEEQQEFDRTMNEADRLKAEYSRIERLEAAERDAEAPGPRVTYPVREVGEGPPDEFDPFDYRTHPGYRFRRKPEYRRLYRQWLVDGDRYGFASRLPSEHRDTILGTDSKGGYLSTPVELSDQIVKQADDLVYIRQLATVITMGEAKALGIPRLTAHMADANWTTEVQAVTEDTTMAFDRRDLTPFALTKLAKVSIRMLKANANIDNFITMELGYKFAITEEKAWLTGSGSSQPLGVFTASASGIPTSRDVSTGNTTTAIVADNLFSVKYSLKAPYRRDPTTRWVFNRDAIRNVMLLKDSQNRYLWEGSIQISEPDRLLGIPVLESEYAPNTFTTGLYVGLLGAFRYYWIAQVDELEIQRLNELYAGTNEVGFIGRRWLDGAPILSEAFARVKLA